MIHNIKVMEDQLYEVNLVLTNEFGEFVGRKAEITLERYDNLVKLSKSFYSGGFELTCEDDSYVIFSPEIVKKSILTIHKKLIENKNV
jgi:hypothetical protein